VSEDERQVMGNSGMVYRFGLRVCGHVSGSSAVFQPVKGVLKKSHFTMSSVTNIGNSVDDFEGLFSLRMIQLKNQK
jgi:hypothetical protein